MLKLVYLKDLGDVDPSNISVVGGGKEIKQGKLGVEVTAVITYKTSSMVSFHCTKSSLALVEGVACNTIFSWPFLHTNKSSIMTEKMP